VIRKVECGNTLLDDCASE